MKKQRGFTLIELMISLLIGLALLAGIIQLFKQSQKIYRTQQGTSFIMEDGSYIVDLFRKELRQTGFLRNKNASNNSAYDLFQVDLSVLNSVPAIDLDLGDYIRGFTDTRYTVPQDSFVIRYQVASPEALEYSPCTKDIIFQSDELEPANAYYAKPSEVPNIVTLYFFVAEDEQDKNILTLYCRAKRERIDFTNIPPNICAKNGCQNYTMPLVSNIEKLVIKYGIENNIGTELDPNIKRYYVNAIDVDDWTKVKSIKVFVVMRSEDDNLLKKRSGYSIEGTYYPKYDKRVYRVFSTVIAFRN